MENKIKIVQEIVEYPDIKFVKQWDETNKTQMLLEEVLYGTGLSIEIDIYGDLIISKQYCLHITLSPTDYFTINSYGMYGKITKEEFDKKYKIKTKEK